MTITDRERRDIYTGLENTLGEEVANNLMALLPNQPASELATKDDLRTLGSELRGEMAELRGELRGEMAELRAELKGDMTELRSELRGEMADLKSTLTAHTTRAMVGSVAANTLAVFAAVGLT